MSRFALNENATQFFFVPETQQFVQGVKWWRQQVACVSSKHPFANFNIVCLAILLQDIIKKYYFKKYIYYIIHFYYVIPDDDSSIYIKKLSGIFWRGTILEMNVAWDGNLFFI